jgi:hypothetical protein
MSKLFQEQVIIKIYPFAYPTVSVVPFLLTCEDNLTKEVLVSLTVAMVYS